jgi:hypothetical protein
MKSPAMCLALKVAARPLPGVRMVCQAWPTSAIKSSRDGDRGPSRDRDEVAIAKLRPLVSDERAQQAGPQRGGQHVVGLEMFESLGE